MKRKISVFLSIFLLTFVVGCTNNSGNSNSSSSSPSSPSNPSISNSDVGSSGGGEVIPPEECEFCNSKPATITYPAEEDYTPITFAESSYSKTLNATLADGVELYKVEYDLTTVSTGNHITAYFTEVDLTKASIVAGTANNSTNPAAYTAKAKIINQVNAWKEDYPDRQVYMATNADFFGAAPVNAFVKDGVILKSGHNVDYNDVPVSSPYLFGISGDQAQIATMTKSKVQSENVEAKLSYGLEIYNPDCSSDIYDVAIDEITENQNGWIYQKEANVSNRTVYELTRTSLVNNFLKAHVTDIIEVTGTQSFTPSRNTTYLVVEETLEEKIQLNTQIAVGFTKSVDGVWNYYDTIIGARHSLVEEGKLASTVSQETSNGAKSRVPRTAIGIKNDGKVIIVSIEDLEYGRKAEVNTGVNLTELADLMRYYGAYNAANFDGGGSTQLLVNQNNIMTVKVRSSDYGEAYFVENSRRVMNTIMVVSK